MVGRHVLALNVCTSSKALQMKFIAAMLDAVKNIKPGEPGVGNYGPATMPKQLDIIASHIKDAY